MARKFAPAAVNASFALAPGDGRAGIQFLKIRLEWIRDIEQVRVSFSLFGLGDKGNPATLFCLMLRTQSQALEVTLGTGGQEQ